MSSYSVALSAHLKSLRAEYGLTLNELASKAGVSRATLSRIENADASPTAETLGTLSSVYQLPISALVAPLDNTFESCIRADDQSVWQDSANGFCRKSVSPPCASLTMEMIEGHLSPHQQIDYEKPSITGQEHHLVMLEGQLFMQIEDKGYQLNQGDCLRYKLFGASRFITKERDARYLIAVSRG